MFCWKSQQKSRYRLKSKFQQISEALRLLCQLLTEDLSGYAERVSFDRLVIFLFFEKLKLFSFAEIYKFMADLGGIPSAQVELALSYLKGEA